jgi:HAT1-interacting factor 1
MASNDEQPTTAVEAAVAPETTDISASADTTGTASIVSDIAQAAASVASSAPTTPGIATAGTATPFELDERQRRLSLDVSLADLCAKATALYVQKKYEDAADIFSRATEMQAEMNGEMNPKNAEILFLYGRALYKVGQSKSDVLGGAAPVTEGEGAKKTGSKKANGVKKAADGAEPEKIIEKAIAGAGGDVTEAKLADTDKKPLIQIEGDEDSDEEMVGSLLLYEVLVSWLTGHCRMMTKRRRAPKRKTTTSRPLSRCSISLAFCSRRGLRPSSSSQIQRRARVKTFQRVAPRRLGTSRSG